MISVLTQLIAFIVSVAVVVTVMHWARKTSGSLIIALLATGCAGAILSGVADFTFAYADADCDRSLEAIAQRTVVSGVLSMILGFLTRSQEAIKSN